MSTMPMRPPPMPAIPWRAFLIAPLAAPAAYVVIVTIEALISRPGAISFGSFAQLAALSLVAGAPIAYATALVIGLPLYLSLARLDFVRAPVILVDSAAAGAVWWQQKKPSGPDGFFGATSQSRT